jgi:hypothetical protein
VKENLQVVDEALTRIIGFQPVTRTHLFLRLPG